MRVNLKRLPASIKGIYGPGSNIMPQRALLLHPTAYNGFLSANLALANSIVCSDIYRSAESSLDAVRSGRGAQPPAYSGHNFGLSIDVAIDKTLALTGLGYPQLLSHMESHGWYCFRRDGLRGREDWHFNYLADQAVKVLQSLSPGRWSLAAESQIIRYYSNDFVLMVIDIQDHLRNLKMYGGAVDGQAGALTKQAVEVFSRAWAVPNDIRDVRFQRTLAFVAADYDIQEQPPRGWNP